MTHRVSSGRGRVPESRLVYVVGRFCLLCNSKKTIYDTPHETGGNRVKYVVRILPIIVIALLFSACFGFHIKTTFNDDGSGSFSMQMSFSRSLLEMNEDGGEIDIPMSREELEQELGGIEGVRIVDITEEETEENLLISATVEFDNFEALVQNDGYPGDSASLTTEGGETVYRMNVGEAKQEATAGEEEEMVPQEEMDEATMAMIKAFMEGYSMEYTIVAPREIKRHSHGELSEDGKSVVLSIPMGEYFMMKEPYTMEIAW